MKICFLHRNLPPDSFTGVAVQVHRLANALIDLGHDVTVYSHSLQPKDAKYRVEVIAFPGLRIVLHYLPALKRVWFPLWNRKLSWKGYDAIHIHGDGGLLQYRGNFVRTFYGTAALEFRFATTLKGKIAQGFSYWMERREAKTCTLTIGISPHVAAYLPNVERTIPCMLPCEPDLTLPAKTPFPSLLFLGSRNSRKRGQIALDLFGKLKVAFPNLTLTYISHKTEIETLKGLPEYQDIEFLTEQAQADLNNVYRRSWIYLCFSTYEGFGVGMIEAMAFNALVVTVPHPGSEYVIRDGDTGIVTDIETMEQTLLQLIPAATRRGEIIQRARESAKRFSPAIVGSAYAELYRVARARSERAST